MSEAKYQDCYVAFLDILGFKELLKDDDFDKIFRKSDWHLRQIDIIRCMIRNNGYFNS